MGGIASIGKMVLKSKAWQSLTRAEVELSTLGNLGFNIPKNATQAVKISGTKANGLSADFYLFKDKLGRSCGSRSLYSDGTSRIIDIERGRAHEISSIPMLFDDAKKTVINNRVYKNGLLTKESHTLSEVWKADKDLKNLSEKEYAQFFGGEQKPTDVDKIYQGVIRIQRNPQADGIVNFTQEIRNIETGLTPSNNYVRHTSTMAQDGELTLNSIEQSSGLNIDTSNPYFKNILLEKTDMLKSRYADIVKERGFKGIEPPLVFDTNSNAFTGIYKQAGGIADRDGSCVGINLSPYGKNLQTKNVLASRLGHECQHEFGQHVDVHLAGIRDMRSVNPQSIKFYDGVEQRFEKIKHNSEEYKKAQIYAQENEHYNDIVFPDGKTLDTKAHNALETEKNADEFGSIESNYFTSCFDYLKTKFSLLNQKWIYEI